MINLYRLHNDQTVFINTTYKPYIDQLDCNGGAMFLDTNGVFTNLSFDNNVDYSPILHVIKKSPFLAYMYSVEIIKGRWPDAEQYIMKDSYGACGYADMVMNSRWPEAEPIIMMEPFAAYLYAAGVLEERWVEAEPTIMKDPDCAFKYARGVLKRPWPEAEHIIKTNGEAWMAYRAFCRSSEIDITFQVPAPISNISISVP